MIAVILILLLILSPIVLIACGLGKILWWLFTRICIPLTIIVIILAAFISVL